jgi:hypothetical protein
MVGGIPLVRLLRGYSAYDVEDSNEGGNMRRSVKWAQRGTGSLRAENIWNYWERVTIWYGGIPSVWITLRIDELQRDCEYRQN